MAWLDEVLDEVEKVDEIKQDMKFKDSLFGILKGMKTQTLKESPEKIFNKINDPVLTLEMFNEIVENTEDDRFYAYEIVEAVVRRKRVIRGGKRKVIRTTDDDKTYVDAGGKAHKKTGAWMLKQKKAKKKVKRKMTSGKKRQAVRRRAISMKKVH